MQANSNIALIKYWGKRDEKLFLPTKSSISIFLPDFITRTEITEINSYKASDQFFINKQELVGPEHEKLAQFLDKFYELNNLSRGPIKIVSTNSFPTAAGLASSASGFAALTKSLNEFHNLKLSNKKLSILARQGSGSACRSIYDGFVIWHRGKDPDGSDSFAEQLYPPEHWPEFRILVCLINKNQKKISSRVAMKKTINTSHIYKSWVGRSENRINPMINAIKNRDIHTVGQLAEHDALEMHACMRAGEPPVDYFLPETHTAIELAQKLRLTGLPCYVTIDAGPNVKIITLDQHVEQIIHAYDIIGLCIK